MAFTYGFSECKQLVVEEMGRPSGDTITTVNLACGACTISMCWLLGFMRRGGRCQKVLDSRNAEA